MYYSTTSILPQRPGKQNNAQIKFLDALLKKMAKEKISNRTKVAAKSVKRSVARLRTKNTGSNVRSVPRNSSANVRSVPKLPMMSSNKLFKRNTSVRKNTPRKKTPKSALTRSLF